MRHDIAAVKAAGVNGYAIFTYENMLVDATAEDAKPKNRKLKNIGGKIRY